MQAGLLIEIGKPNLDVQRYPSYYFGPTFLPSLTLFIKAKRLVLVAPFGRLQLEAYDPAHPGPT